MQRLDDEVRDRLEVRRGEWRQIAIAADVSYSWLSKFMRREIPNPGYETLLRIRAALLNKKG
jgi:transcriptional regulator with XRE-family HTH domain